LVLPLKFLLGRGFNNNVQEELMKFFQNFGFGKKSSVWSKNLFIRCLVYVIINVFIDNEQLSDLRGEAGYDA
jgi:hypothetical protein